MAHARSAILSSRYPKRVQKTPPNPYEAPGCQRQQVGKGVGSLYLDLETEKNRRSRLKSAAVLY